MGSSKRLQLVYTDSILMNKQLFHHTAVLTYFIKEHHTNFTFSQIYQKKKSAFFYTYSALVKLPYCRCLHTCRSPPEPPFVCVWAEEESRPAKTRDNSILLPNWLPYLLLKTLCGSHVLPDHAGTYLLPAFSTTENLESSFLGGKDMHPPLKTLRIILCYHYHRRSCPLDVDGIPDIIQCLLAFLTLLIHKLLLLVLFFTAVDSIHIPFAVFFCSSLTNN